MDDLVNGKQPTDIQATDAKPLYYAWTCPRCGATIYCDKRYRPICGICGAHL